MLLRPYSIKRPNNGVNTLSPKGVKKPNYIKFKGDIQKSTKSGRSLYSVETQRQSSSLTNRRMLSHRKLISLSSLEHRQNLTDRKLPNSLRENKFTISQDVPLQPQQVQSSLQPKQSSATLKLNQQPSSIIAKFKRKTDRLYTIQNIEGKQQNLQKALQIKENILKQFIGRFQEELREISLQKSHSTVASKTLVTNRNFKNKSHIKEETTKKSHKNIITAGSLESHGSTLNLSNSINNKQNIPVTLHEQISQKNKFQVYIKQLQDHKKKDQKIFIMKNHKRSLQSISISKIGETQTLLTNRVATKLEPKNNKMNLKQLFRHSKKYEPYLREGSTLAIQNSSPKIQQAIQEKQSKLQRSSSAIQSSSNQKIGLREIGYMDCSSIEKINESSFISDVGRKSLLKHLEKQRAKLVRQQSKKSKKCLMKMKSVFPADFF